MTAGGDVGRDGEADLPRADGEGITRLSLVFSRPVGLPDVQYTVQAADRPDASTWQTVGTLTVTPNDPPQTETVTGWDSVATGDAPQRFLRLMLTLDAAGG